jgi:hypothetical protein
MNTHGAVSSATVVNRFGNWEKAVEFAVDASDDREVRYEAGANHEDTDITGNNLSGGDSKLSDDQQKEQSSVTTGTEITIPEKYAIIATVDSDNRPSKPIPVKVHEINMDSGSRRSKTIHIEDMSGERTDLNVWETHNINIEWTIDEWYVLEEVITKSWTNSDGEVKQELSTTIDFAAKHVEERPDADKINSDNEPTSQSDTVVQTNMSDSATDSRPDINILDGIESEFNDL